MTYEELCKMKTVACITIKDNGSQLDELKAVLDKGLELGVAKRIVAEIWGDTREAIMIKTRLSGNFPKDNGDQIKYSNFNAAARNHFAAMVEPIFLYFRETRSYIEAEVAKIMELLKGSDLTDEGVMLKYNEFRKEVMRYISALTYCSASSFKNIDETKIESFKDIPLSDSHVEQGDYLFLDCFKDRLERCHKETLLNMFEKEVYSYQSISDFRWQNESMEGYVWVTDLFAKYLSSFTEQ